jgi:hypothetical protein
MELLDLRSDADSAAQPVMEEIQGYTLAALQCDVAVPMSDDFGTDGPFGADGPGAQC